MLVSSSSPSLRAVQPQFGMNRHRNNDDGFEMVRLEAGNRGARNRELPSSDSPSRSFGGRHKWKLLAAAVIGAPIATVGALLAHCNNAPGNTIASARQYGLNGACPAYLTESGDVYSGLPRWRSGRIETDGQAKDLVGLSRGNAAKDGKLYKDFVGIDEANLPLPSARVEEDGTVKDWPIPTPIGKIKKHKEDIPKQQRDALGFWVLSK